MPCISVVSQSHMHWRIDRKHRLATSARRKMWVGRQARSPFMRPLLYEEWKHDQMVVLVVDLIVKDKLTAQEWP